MKKAILIISIFTFLSLFSFNLAATDIDYGKEYDGFLAGIPEEVAPYIPGEIFEGDTDGIFNGARELSEPKAFFEKILNFLGFYIDDGLSMLARFLGLVLFSALVRALLSGVENSGVKEAFSLCCCAVMVLFVMEEQTRIIEAVRNFLERLLSFVNSMLPLVGVLYAGGGNISTAAVGTSSLGFFIAVTENICVFTLMPIVGICLAFSAAGAIGGKPIGEVSSFVKKAYTYGLGLITSIFALVMGMQNQLSSKADSLGARAAKYAVGNFIPVVGGAVGDSLRTVAASVEYIRGAVGSIGIAIIILLLLPTLITLLFSKLSVDIASFASKLLGCEREGKFLSEISNVYGYMIAVCSICSVLFIYALTLFIRCSALGW